MVTKATVINWVKGLANAGTGVDADGVFGMQCVDLPNMLAQKFFGRSMPGNGIDMLAAGRANGWVTTGAEKPHAGAIFCMRVSYHGYGHTGVVVSEPDASGRFQTVEQNVDGGMSGGPARYRTRSLGNPSENIIGFIYPPYADGISGIGSTPPKPKNLPEGATMDFTFTIKGDPNWNSGTVFFYNGAVNEIQPVHNLEELKYLRSVYKDTHDDHDLKHYDWNNNVPVYVRIFGAVRPSTSDNNVKATLEKLLKQLENAT